MIEIRDRAIVQEVQNSNTRKSLRNNVCEYGGSGASVHWLQTAKDVVKLREGIDEHEYVCCLQSGGIPEDHPGYNLSTSFLQVSDTESILAMQRLPTA